MIVVDASIIGKAFLPWEDKREKVEKILQKHIDREDEIIVPDLLFYEVINALITKTALPLNIAQNSIKELYKLGLKIYHPSEKSMHLAAKLAKEGVLSVYDAIYAVLAKEKKCSLITADEKFVEMVKLPFIKTLKVYQIS